MIGKHLHQAGKISTADIKKIPESEYGDVFGEFTPNVVGCNAKNRADRLSALGWKPQELSVEAAYEKEELPILLEGSGPINPLVLS